MELFILFEFMFPFANPVYAQSYGFNKADSWLIWVIAAAVYIVICAFKGVGLYTMAKKRGKKPILCLCGFVPFASTYLMGELAGELRMGKTKLKHLGLFVMLAELILCIGYGVQDISQSIIFMDETLYVVRPVESGNLTYLTLYFTEAVPSALVYAMNFFSIFCGIFYFIWLVLFIFLCMAFFRAYAPASYIWMVVLCAIFPVITGFFAFAFRNREPIDYDKYMQARMERIRRAQQAQYGPYGPYGGNPYGQNPNPYGNPYGQNSYGQNPYGQNGYGGQGAPKEPDDPFGEYSSPASNGGSQDPSRGAPPQGGAPDDPFGEYGQGGAGNSDDNK